MEVLGGWLFGPLGIVCFEGKESLNIGSGLLP
jgi:hypothetical protein